MLVSDKFHYGRLFSVFEQVHIIMQRIEQSEKEQKSDSILHAG